MRSEQKLQILITIYQEVASHLRATDDKRDHIFEIYVTVVLAIITGMILLLQSTTKLSIEILGLAVILILILLALGECVYIAMIGSRKWHAEYVNCSIILHSMMSREICNVSPDLVSLEERYQFIGPIHTNREFVMVDIAIVGTYFMAANLLTSLQIGDVIYVAAILAGIFTTFINIVAGNRVLRRAEHQFWKNPRTSWIFSGLEFHTNNTSKNV